MVESAPNPWPLRVAIAGAVMLLLGAFLLTSQSGSIDETNNPRNVALLSATGPGSEVASLEPGCYHAIAVKGANNMDLSLTKIEGSSRVSEPLEDKICATDWQAMATDNTQFVIAAGWDVDEGAEYALDATCNENTECTNDTVYLVHTNPYQYAILGDAGFLFGLTTCCAGLLLLPLAGVLLMFSRAARPKGSVVMMNPDGTMSEAQEITPEMMAAFARGENPLQPKVEAPFADTGIGGEPETFVDGKQSVMDGNLLTTEQVYALMRGDVEQAGKTVEDPFADRPSQPKSVVPIKDPNTQTIASWDEGDAAPSIAPTSVKTKIDVQPIKKEFPKKAANDDWRAWDEV
jgi:hypothetical protein